VSDEDTKTLELSPEEKRALIRLLQDTVENARFPHRASTP
jgi:hypothetical protein